MSKYQSGSHGGLEAVPAKHDYLKALQGSDGFDAQAAQKAFKISKPPSERKERGFSSQYSQSSEIGIDERTSRKPLRWTKTTVVLAILSRL